MLDSHHSGKSLAKIQGREYVGVHVMNHTSTACPIVQVA